MLRWGRTYLLIRAPCSQIQKIVVFNLHKEQRSRGADQDVYFFRMKQREGSCELLMSVCEDVNTRPGSSVTWFLPDTLG